VVTILTDHLMLDVLRSTTTTPGELCVITALTTMTLKSLALCSDMGNFMFFFAVPYVIDAKFAIQVKTISCI